MSSFLTKVIKSRLLKKSTLSSLNNITVRSSSLWEPDYITFAKNQPPVHDLLNFQMRGYDFVTLEKYQSVVHSLASKLGLDVIKAWSTPCQDLKVTTLKPHTSVVVEEYFLHLYERNLQFSHVRGAKLSLLIDLALTACPPGVKVSIHKHLDDMEDIRYIPELEIIEVEEKIEEINKKMKK